MKGARVPRTIRAYVGSLGRAANEPLLALWSLYMLLVPVDTFGSGGLQPGDYLVVALFPAVLFTGRLRLPRGSSGAVRALLVFVGYVVLSAVVWTAVVGELSTNFRKGFALSPAFYIYNALIFTMVLVLYARYRERFLWLTVQLTLVSLVLQTAISFVYSRGSAIRGAVLFNAANQLGYFALVSASILVLGHRIRMIGTTAAALGLMASAYLSLFSASKAALGGILILAAAGLVASPRLLLVTSAGIVALLSLGSPMLDALGRAQHRIATDVSYGFVEERGYDRILNHKEYWLFGSGEGGYYRFADTTVIGSHEIHSSGGTLFFCYGIVGSVLFLLFGWRVVQGASLRAMVLLLPAAGYSLTHQGLRFNLLWVLLALFLIVKLRRRGPPRPAPPVDGSTPPPGVEVGSSA